MATQLGTGLTECPECHEPLQIPVRARQTGATDYVLGFDLSQVREHVAAHETPFTTELPPTAP